MRKHITDKLKNKRIAMALAVMLMTAFTIAGCGASKSAGTENDGTAVAEAETAESGSSTGTTDGTQKEIVVLAAASLTDVCGELEKMYEEKNAGTDLIFSFASSGALQTQIEEGARADIFMSADVKQMNALDEKGLMVSDSIINLLENKLVLIVPSDSKLPLSSFEDVASDEVKMIAIGEPESVPAGKYAMEVFEYLGIPDQVSAKANYGSDVRTVLTWVEENSVDCGVVYKTDAYTSDKVKIICEAPEGSLRQVIYPAGIVGTTGEKEAAEDFLDFIRSDEAMEVFASYGFTEAGNK